MTHKVNYKVLPIRHLLSLLSISVHSMGSAIMLILNGGK